jgi:sulfur-oxidizing protein SoxY
MIDGRRQFLRLAAAGLAGGPTLARAAPAGAGDRRPPDRLHQPVLRLPVATGNGNKVPIVVEMAHPMEREHYVRSIEVVNPRDPVPSKGVFHFTPANGEVYVAFQARMDAGPSDVLVTADCTVHGRSSSRASITVAEGTGGCAGPDASRPPRASDLRPPRVRIPALLRRPGVRPNEVFEVQLLIEHPNRTGLTYRGGAFVQETEPFHLERIEVFHGDEPVSHFATTPALSDDPFIRFRLRVRREALLRVVATNNQGRQLVTAQPIPLLLM